MLQQDFIMCSNAVSLAMKKKQIFLTVLVAVVAFTSLASVQADEKGYWTYYDYTDNIAQGDGLESSNYHSSAQDAYATILYSSGKCTLDYEWNQPYLDVVISNDDTHAITVTWREYYYEN